jgi:hypothetical protein
MKSSPKSNKKSSQPNLHSFFKITPPSEPKHKKCFIYDPGNKIARFDYQPLDTDAFIVAKSSIKLYYRKPTTAVPLDNFGKPDDNPNSYEVSSMEFPHISSASPPEYFTINVPLLKSNLQKAVRRCHNSIAIQSAIQLIHLDKTQFLRRLPIIYIEDVCLMDSFPMVIWLMMADKHYAITPLDIDILLHCVNGLCDCKNAIECRTDPVTTTYSHEDLENLSIHTELLGLYYRSQYGGMGGDMRMLENAIEYYMQNPDSIEKTQYGLINYEELRNMDIEILVEAIDFHPFPHMLSMLEKKTGLDKMVIKEYIWVTESGYNIRKSETMQKSQRYMAREEWQVINQYLDSVRDLLFSP